MMFLDKLMRRETMPRPANVTIEAGEYTITVSGEALDALLDVAGRERLSLAEAIGRAIAVQKAVADAKVQGRKVYIEPKGDAPRELVTA